MIEFINDEKVITLQPIGGGCIGQSFKVMTNAKNCYFVKNYQKPRIAEAEAVGLNEIDSSGVKAPKVISFSENQLILEFINSGKQVANFHELLGEMLAKLHKKSSSSFGFDSDNFIGATPQKNQPRSENWCEFYWNNRVIEQLYLAEQNGYADKNLRLKISKLEDKIETILSGSDEQSTLVHGDFWNGNYMVDEKGEPVFIDPAVYYGHRETDIAMTILFGGFSEQFYDIYNSTLPLKDGWKSRIEFYKLYHLLNHLNLFGMSYYQQSIDAISYYVG